MGPSFDGNYYIVTCVIGNHRVCGECACPFDCDNLYEVDPATVGQFTGLCDKNGKKIFEGDIIKTDFHEMKMSVCYKTRLASFALENRHWMYPHYFQEAVKPKDVEVIGNIHDNFELLKEEAE